MGGRSSKTKKNPPQPKIKVKQPNEKIRLMENVLVDEKPDRLYAHVMTGKNSKTVPNWVEPYFTALQNYLAKQMDDGMLSFVKDVKELKSAFKKGLDENAYRNRLNKIYDEYVPWTAPKAINFDKEASSVGIIRSLTVLHDAGWNVKKNPKWRPENVFKPEARSVENGGLIRVEKIPNPESIWKQAEAECEGQLQLQLKPFAESEMFTKWANEHYGEYKKWAKQQKNLARAEEYNQYELYEDGYYYDSGDDIGYLYGTGGVHHDGFLDVRDRIYDHHTQYLHGSNKDWEMIGVGCLLGLILMGIVCCIGLIIGVLSGGVTYKWLNEYRLKKQRREPDDENDVIEHA